MADFPEIPGYEILTILGEGGVATVYLGIQENLKRKVAIKVLEPILLRDKVTSARFAKEARIAANLSHSNIVQIYDTGKVGAYHFIVMEYLEESLKDRLIRRPRARMQPEMALDLVEELLKALDYAHFRGIYHRDIKPENIMLRQDGTPVLVDFGIAHVYDSTDQFTKSGMIIGTVDYMSPEQCKSEKIDGRSDVYSLGVVFFEMVTGDTPYRGDSPLTIALKHIDQPIPLLPRELSRFQPLLDKMMAKNVDERISSAPQFNQVLDRILTDPNLNEPDLLPESPGESVKDNSYTYLTTVPTRVMTKVIHKYLGFMKDKLDFIKNKFL